MRRSLLAAAALVALVGVQLVAQRFPPGYVDPAPLLAAAAKEIGEATLKCITFSGTGYGGAVGQTFENAVNIDWPRIDSLANYTRTINWETGTSKETFDRKPGIEPGVVEVRPRLAGRHADADERSAKRTSSTAATRGTSTATARPSPCRRSWPSSISSISG